MGEKEKKFIEYLGLLISLLILFLILGYTIDFRLFKANKCANRMIDYLCKNDYKTFYQNLDDNNLLTWDTFLSYQENINQQLGKIKSCTYYATYPGDDKNDILVVYNAEYEKFEKQNIRIILEIEYNDNAYNVIQYKILPLNDASNNELSICINNINSTSNYNSDEFNKINDFIQNIIYEYDKENYENIYSKLTDDLKQKGEQEEFVNYLKWQHDKYGDLRNTRFNGYEMSRDQTEYKFNYNLYNDDNTYITLYVKDSGGLYLSGIKFNEKTW